MPTVATYAVPLTAICVEVPPAGAGVCRVCHGSPNPGFSTCYSCSQVMGQVSRPCERVVPVSLYEIPSQLYNELADYKRSSNPAIRNQSSLKVVSILCHFLGRHRACIAGAAGGDWSIITGVPSTKSTTGEHALVKALRRVPSTFAEYEDLLARGSSAIGHNQASDTGYIARRSLTGERVLLIDDTFTSGARAQSAASSLALAGAEVVAIVVVGRVFKPAWSDTTRSFWVDRLAQPFDFDTCCVH